MPKTNTVPVTITPGAEARLEQLGLRRDLERMLEYMRQNFYGLRAIELNYDEMAELRGEAEMHFTVHRQRLPDVDWDRTQWEGAAGWPETFPRRAAFIFPC